MQSFNVLHAESIEEAIMLLKDHPVRARVMAGGTDIIGGIKRNIYPHPTELLVNLQRIPGLDYIKAENGTLRIGAMTKLSAIAEHPLVREKFTALAQAAERTASPQLRNMGTIGGNVCQDVRCWYLRTSDDYFDCLKKGGHFCYAIEGDNRYHSIFGGIRVQGLPCTSRCPSSIKIPEYLQLIQAGKKKEAAAKLLENNPLPAITGRVCPHFCESECNRCAVDDAVSIREVERNLGDFILDHADELLLAPVRESGKRIAVVGAGPAGLSAAFYLRRLGHAVTVYDAGAEAGGMLRYAIPAYRLPRDIICRQVKALKKMGICFHQGIKIGETLPFSDLARDYDAVFLACGAGKERPSGIAGEENLIPGLEFLSRLSRGCTDLPGQSVAVLGGGNAAIDVARSLLRLGAKVTLIYRRTKDEMPAIREDVEKAREEGVEFMFLAQPRYAKRDDGVKLGCIKIQLGEPDSSGRPRPMELSGSDFELQFDAVITAFGEIADTSFLPEAYLDGKGWFRPNGKVFGGGDFVSGASTVTQAMSGGRQATESIHRFLGGGSQHCYNCSQVEISGCAAKGGRHFTSELPVAQRTLTEEDVTGFGAETASEEAERCLNCACVAVNPSDTAPALVALNAVMVTNLREIPADCFWTSAAPASTMLEGGEILLEIRFPAPPHGAKSAFVKFADRAVIDFPVVNCAAMVCPEDVRICLNAVSPLPYRVYKAEESMVGHVIDAQSAHAAAEAGVSDAVPLSCNSYKIDIARAMIEQALLNCR